MKRTGSLSRYTQLRRKVRVKARNAKRCAKNWTRSYGSSERAAFVRSLYCVICNTTPCENAHVGRNHMGYKADASTVVPLCAKHHRKLHEWGRETFETFHNVNLEMFALETDALWRRMGGE